MIAERLAQRFECSTRRSPLTRLFLRDRNRFPQSGGFAVAAGTNTTVSVVGKDRNRATIEETFGPFPIADGAIVDLEFQL